MKIGPILLHRLVKEKYNNNNNELSLNEITQLEEDLDAALVQTRSRKVKVMCLFDYFPSLFHFPYFFC